MFLVHGSMHQERGAGSSVRHPGRTSSILVLGRLRGCEDPPMRTLVAPPVALALTAVLVPLAGGAFATTAVAQDAPDACAERLDTAGRQVERFRAGSRTLSWGRVVATPTRADDDRYCVEIRFGGRTPNHRSSTRGFARRNGRWVAIGGDGGGAEPRASYTQTVQMPARRRSDRTYEVRADGRWYAAVVSLRNP
jgi:hypothetical protein